MFRKTVLSLGLLATLSAPPRIMASEANTGGMRIKVIAATCNICHGPHGQSLGATPSLAGQDRDHLRQAMIESKTGARETTVMRKYMLGYSDEEISLLADFFANLR